MKTLALIAALAFFPTVVQAGENITSQERATGVVSLLYHQKHCGSLSKKAKLGLASLLTMGEIPKKDTDRAMERIDRQVTSLGLTEWCGTNEALIDTAFR